MYITVSAQMNSSAILTFLKWRGGHYFPIAFKLFEAKPLAQFLYDTELGPFSSFAPLELVQSKYLDLLSPKLCL